MTSTNACTRQSTMVGSADSSTVDEPSRSGYVTARTTATERATSSCAASVTAVEEQIERSKSHWSQLVDHDSGLTQEEEEVAAAVDNRAVFQALQQDPTWGFFFCWWHQFQSLEVGEKFAEGAQAELFHAHVTWANPKLNEYDREKEIEHVLKVFKKGTRLRHLHSQLPHGYLHWKAELLQLQKLGDLLPYRHSCEVEHGVLLEDGRFAYVMEKEDGDLRSLIDRNILHGSQGCGPFPKEQAEEIMYRVAQGMNELHSRDIVHRDLKASNVLVWEYDSEKYGAFVADFECSIGVVGTGFFRAPEILQACKEQNVNQKQELFSRAADVYSYGMTCYEILTGLLPFKHHPLSHDTRLLTDLVINGLRPEVPDFVEKWAVELLERCWQSDPAARPSFAEILSLLEANSDSEYIKEEVADRG